MQLYDAPPPTNSGTDEYSYQPGYLGGYAYAEGEYYGYDAYHEYNFKECCHYCGYADSVSAYIEDWDLDSAYSGYIGYAPDEDYGEAYVYGELEYYYEYIPIHGYVRRYMHSRGDIQAYGGYIGFAPLSIPVLPPLPTMPSDFTNIVDVPISVTTVPDIQTAIDWIGINGNTANAYRIRLNFPGNQAIGTTTINFDVGHHIIVDSYNNYNQVWFHHATTRHLSIGPTSAHPLAVVELADVTLSRNLGNGPGTVSAATNGGGVIIGRGTLIMNHQRATISNNRSTAGGAAVINPLGTGEVRFWINAGQMEYNTSNDGGAIWADGVGIPIHKVMTGGYIRHNISYGQGGVFSQCCWIWMWVDGTHIYGNTAATDGGAFFVNPNNNHIYVLSGEIYNNTAHGNGGAIYVSGSITLAGGYIHNNRAISANIANGNGGAIFSQSPRFRVFGGTVTNNQASGDGGAIYFSSLYEWDLINPLNIAGNRALGNGGGIWAGHFGADIVLCDNATISNNTAGGNGGGIYRDLGGSTPLLILRGGTISNNGHATTVYTHGGGSFPNITLSPVSINTQRGGGIAINHGVFRAEYGSIIGNAALGSVDMWSGDLVNGYGGAVYLNTIPAAGLRQMNIYGPGTITLNNNEARIGGAIRIAGNQVVFNDADNTGTINIIGNRATQYGGGISVNMRNTDALAVNLNEHWIINDNEAGRSGGGIHINQSRVTLNGCTIQGNEALGIGTGAGGGGGGIFIGGLNTLLVIQSGTLIDDNTAYIGGGIRILGHGSNVGQNNRYGIIMHGGTISNNTATATNTANHGGGGVAVQSMFSGAWDYVVFGMYGGYIIGNVSYRGGGINVNYNAETIIGDGTISGNIARQGGGIYVYSSRSAMEFLPHPPWTINRPRAVRILGGTITNNQATTTPTAQYTPREVNPTTGAVITPGIYNGSGGGIYVVMGSGAQISNASITNNHAHEMGGGIFTELYQYYVATLTESDVYTNLVIANTTTFEDNTAGQGDFLPPTNAYDWTNIPGQAQGGSQSIHNHPINNYDINFRREAVTTIPFTFHKTTSNVYTTPNLVNIADITPFLLEGAYFSLFRFEGTGTPPTTVIYPSADWERVYYDVRSTGLLANPITMEITPDGIYHLVEILAPSGFQTPFGQWRITHDDNAPGEFVIFAVGGSAPSFEYLDGFFYVGNIPDFELPLTGRTGHNLILWAGSLALLAGFGMWAYLNFFAGKKGEKYNNQII